MSIKKTMSIRAEQQEIMEERRERIRSRLLPPSPIDYRPGEEEEDPEVSHMTPNSAPRVIFAGEDLVEVKMPPGSRVIRAREPRRPLGDPRGAVRYALLHPLKSPPLPELLRPGMKVVIALDDLSMPLPAMKSPDIRSLMLEETIALLDAAGVEDVRIIIAIALHRRMKPREIRRITGSAVFDRFYPDRLYNHDAENESEMTRLGVAEGGEVVQINRRAAECDLLIYLNLNFVPMNGGHKSVATGLSGYEGIREHHDPEVIAACNSYMDPEHSELARSNRRINGFIEAGIKVFHVESTLNTEMFSPALSFLAKDEDEYTAFDIKKKNALRDRLKNIPPAVRRKLFARIPAPYGVTMVQAGEVNAVHERILSISRKQYAIRVKGQADVLAFGVPFVCPYSVNSILNPLLVQVMALGYIYNLYEGGVPLLREGGVMILFHPCRDEFDAEAHPSYIEFFNRLLPESRDSIYLQNHYEEEFASNPEYIRLYREGYAFHGVHPFYMWYWGENGRRRVGRVIVVGAKDKHVPVRLGWENADNFEQALEMARRDFPEPRVTLLKTSPMLITRCV